MARISIAGGGIAGLALAATLDPRQHNVTIFEERPDRPPAGTGLGMWPSAMRALDGIGLGDSVRDRSLEIRRATIRDRHDRPLVSQEAEHSYLIARPELLRVLSEATSGTNREVRRVEHHRDIPADAIVGADGVHSAVRRSAFGPRAHSRRAGIAIFRGVADGGVASASEFWDARTIGGVMPLRDERRNWYLAVRTPQELSRVTEIPDGERKSLALRYASRFPARLSDAIADTNDAALLFQHLWVSPMLIKPYRDDVVLIGDAAHAMTPNLGRGACESIVDGIALGTELNSAADPRDAIRRYARRRALPAAAVKAASNAVLRLSTAHRGTSVRDQALRVASSLAR